MTCKATAISTLGKAKGCQMLRDNEGERSGNCPYAGGRGQRADVPAESTLVGEQTNSFFLPVLCAGAGERSGGHV